MKNARQSSIIYFLRNFLFILLLAGVPAALFALARAEGDSYTPIEFFLNAFTNLGTFSLSGANFVNDIYRYFTMISTNARLWWLWWVAIIACFLALCLEFAMVERHMRLGVRSLTSFARMFNDTVLSVLPYFLTSLFMYEFITLISCGVIYVVALVGVKGVTLYFSAFGLYAAGFVLFCVYFSYTICTIPSMLSDGYKYNVAASYSARLVTGNLPKVFIKIFLTIICAGVLMLISAALVRQYEVAQPAHILVMFVYYLFLIGFLPVFSMRTYNALVGNVRKDIKKKLF